MAKVNKIPKGKVKVAPSIPPKEPNDHRLTLVLDLDETLVHCSTTPNELPNPDIEFDVPFQNRNFHVYVQK
jgi:CTD small phosphatase-like protein 2